MPNHILTRAPARICLFGDHQDYLGLPVIACAIDRHIRLEARPNGLRLLQIDKPDIGERRTIDLDHLPGRAERGDHLMAALKLLNEYGHVPNRGYDVLMSGNIPINAGVSSSSAVLVAWVRFLLAAYAEDRVITPAFVSRFAYEAEVTYHGAPGGKMDQYSIGLGKVIYLETGDELYYEVFDREIPGLIVAESGIPKDTTGVLGELKERALRAVALVKEQRPDFSLPAATPEALPGYLSLIPEEYRTYLEAAVLNHDITQRALQALRKPVLDLPEIGRLMSRHHAVLAGHLNITLPLIDAMVEAALGAGAYGAKIVGSGRGGCVAVLADPTKEQAIREAILAAGAPAVFAVRVAPGAEVMR